MKVVLEDESKTDAITLSDHSIYNCVLKLVQKHWGDLGEAAVRSGLRCKYCNDQTRIAIIRMKHRPHRFVTSVLPLASVVSCGHKSMYTLAMIVIEICLIFTDRPTLHQVAYFVQWGNDDAMQQVYRSTPKSLFGSDGEPIKRTLVVAQTARGSSDELHRSLEVLFNIYICFYTHFL